MAARKRVPIESINLEGYESTTLEALEGQSAYLSGVDFGKTYIKYYGGNEEVTCIHFELDGEIYSVFEDPSDDYRSSMREIIKNPKHKIKNKFPEVRVNCIYRSSDSNTGFPTKCCDILDIVDYDSGNSILSVGTDNSDGYYPSFIFDWNPENLVINSNPISLLLPRKSLEDVFG